MKQTILSIISLLLFFTAAVNAQSGGTYEITQSVIAGGGMASAGGNFTVVGTIGQSVAGTQSTGIPASGGVLAVRGGFWAVSALAPTAASVTLAGRVIIAGSGMSRIRITIQNLSTGAVQTAIPSSFGYYQFENLETGVYLVTAASRSFQFSPPSFTLDLTDNVSDANFSGTRNF
ncbi:MAG: carboxypeptidase-like regulatory domain-containing protein [Pyrinomonadaceae bacterium]